MHTVKHLDEFKKYIILSFFSPLLTLVVFIKNYRKPLLVPVGTLLMTLYGFLFYYLPDIDASSHLEETEYLYASLTFSDFFFEIFNIILQKPTLGNLDLYIHFIMYISGNLLGYPKMIHIIAGFFLGLFVSKSIKVIFDLTDNRIFFINSGVFIFIMIITQSIFALNAIRIGTAMWVVFYAALQYYKTKNKKYILLLILSIQIHFAYAIISIPVFLSFFIFKFKKVIFGVFIASFFFSTSSDALKSIIPQTKSVEAKSGYLLNDKRIEERNEIKTKMKANVVFFIAEGSEYFVNYGLVSALFFLSYFYFFKSDEVLTFILSTSYLLWSIINLTYYIPSLGGRMTSLATLFILSGLFYVFVNILSKEHKFAFLFNLYKLFFILVSIPFILKHITHFMSTAEVFFIALPLANIFFEQTISVIQFIKIFI
ncbi:hypothetical protein [Flavobacterium sp.]|uniref:hypothetical protein n=2 Tax=Flavobacterium sp. TaxID=239 RepID=UPI004048E9AF